MSARSGELSHTKRWQLWHLLGKFRKKLADAITAHPQTTGAHYQILSENMRGSVLRTHGNHTVYRWHLPHATTPWDAAADFDPPRPILVSAYHLTPGCPAIDPTTLLRDLDG